MSDVALEDSLEIETHDFHCELNLHVPCLIAGRYKLYTPVLYGLLITFHLEGTRTRAQNGTYVRFFGMI